MATDVIRPIASYMEWKGDGMRTKITLFMMTSTTAALLGIITAIQLRSIQANEGVGSLLPEGESPG